MSKKTVLAALGVLVVVCLCVLFGAAVTVGGSALWWRGPSPAVATPAPTQAQPLTPASTPTSAHSAPPIALPAGLEVQAQALISSARADMADLRGLPVYTINARFDPAGPSIGGDLTVQYTNTGTAALSELYFRLYANSESYGGTDLRMSNVAVDGTSATPVLELQNTAVRVPLARPLLPGGAAAVTMRFDATVPVKNPRGYGLFNQVDGLTALAGWYPILAVNDNGGWQLPTDDGMGDLAYSSVAYYTVNLIVPADYQVCATGVETGREAGPDKTARLTLVTGPVRDLPVVLGPHLQKVTQKVGETTVNSWYLPGQEGAGQKVLKYGADSIDSMSRMFGTYPYIEYDLVGVPLNGMVGGVEFPQLVYIDSDNLYGLLGNLMDTLEFTVAHETGHQWWYGVVGSNPHLHAWQDEALTNYSTVLYFKAVHGADAASRQLYTQIELPFRLIVMQGRDSPVDQPTERFSDEITYSALVYGKGALFFNALNDMVGDDTFYALLQEYFRLYKYQIARPEQLLEVAQTVAKRNLQELYRHWILAAEGQQDVPQGNPLQPAPRNPLASAGGGGEDELAAQLLLALLADQEVEAGQSDELRQILSLFGQLDELLEWPATGQTDGPSAAGDISVSPGFEQLMGELLRQYYLPTGTTG